jgi:hypothetical protein
MQPSGFCLVKGKATAGQMARGVLDCRRSRLASQRFQLWRELSLRRLSFHVTVAVRPSWRLSFQVAASLWDRVHFLNRLRQETGCGAGKSMSGKTSTMVAKPRQMTSVAWRTEAR